MLLNELLNCWSIDSSFDRIINRHVSAVFWRTILSIIDQSHLVPRRYRHPLTINPHIHRPLFSHVFLANWFVTGLVHQLKEAKQLIEYNQSSISNESVGDHSLYVFDWCHDVWLIVWIVINLVWWFFHALSVVSWNINVLGFAHTTFESMIESTRFRWE